MKNKNFQPSDQNNPLRPTFTDIHLSIILIGTESTGNIGAVARSMKNFSFSDLILFNPECEITTETYGFAMHAKDIVDNVKIIRCNSENHNQELIDLLKDYNIVIATSGKIVNYKHIVRTPIFIDELEVPISNPEEPNRIALLFGRESVGLTTEEVRLADILVSIPANPEYPIMNLSHAATIVLFTFYKKLHIIDRGQIIPAAFSHRNMLQDRIDKLLDISIEDEVKRQIYSSSLKNIFGRAFCSRNEINNIIRLFENLFHQLKKQ